MEFLKSLDPVLQLFWYIAIPTSIVFIIQTILTFMGTDASDGIDTDFDGDLDGTNAPFQFFSFRNLINFLLGFSWTGISFFKQITNTNYLYILSVTVGLFFVFLFFIVIKQITKLAEDNTFKITQTLNKTAEVYTPIPEKKTGKGKVLISVNGSYRELEAMTYQERINSGSTVKITQIINQNILIVESI
ncbi:Na+-transporting methylmalonyl-CoA/oxaloacetate decarboxylase gamma subunit [Wenyingzhuangia heitensis]|uniref:Na+-transporting methylmalonyl-CoA/oxaloacetate decarboxylase gamma subunit n=1 Tax=Wenyingzhuangia heitensis TaxID=1487859 RepID=A0ABX0U772_9FLAO|nr:serine protease [Wenyingzhuangia heitensis]NIJ44603.1 Na+-transporting methylmalonyl-CoA/oxaloacetate decarboxylase gamma subunit [Wenyingzhuangia heitensis]